MKNFKPMGKKLLSLLLILGFVLSLIVIPEPMTVQAASSQVSNELKSADVQYSASISGKVLTVTVTLKGKEKLPANEKVALTYTTALRPARTAMGDFKTVSATNERGVFTLDCSDSTKYIPGEYEIYLYIGKQTSAKYSYTGHSYIPFKITSNGMQFNYTMATREQTFVNNINQKYDPAMYNSIPYKCDYANQAGMKKLSATLTKNCKTNEEKLYAIHYWICKNISYDYEAINKGDLTDAADPGKIYKTHRAVCSGYARFAKMLLGYAGVPCLTVQGYATNGNIREEGDVSKRQMNHEWNLVYINGSWKIVDFTWDSGNCYYGANKKDNVTGEEPRYLYYGIPANSFSISHESRKETTKPSYADVVIFISNKSYTYTGKKIFPKPVVKIDGETISNTYYTVSYRDNINVGQGIISIAFKGKYASYGTKEGGFTIKPMGTTISSISGVSHGFKVNYGKKTTQVDGYQVRYSGLSSMKNAKFATIRDNTTTSATVTGVVSGKKLYVQVRTFKMVNGKMITSDWSKAKTVKTK